MVEVSVKAVRSYGKWGVGKKGIKIPDKRIYCFLHYRHFDGMTENPDVFVVPGRIVNQRKKTWHDEWGFYFNKKNIARINMWRDRWDLIY